MEHFEIEIDLNAEERYAYDSMAVRTEQEMNSETYSKNITHIYEIILRLRQLSNHSKLPWLGRQQYDFD